MTKRTLILIVAGWALLTLFNYYYVPFFLLPFEWLGLVLILLIILIVQIVKLFKERQQLTTLRTQKVVVFISLFLLTFFQSFTNGIVEKIDWILLQNKRAEIVEQVKSRQLNPNVSWNGWICELPFEFPVVSNGGNDIGIRRNKKTGKVTVIFWVFRNFFESPSTYFVYTNDPEQIERLKKKVSLKPRENWKIDDNWYRTYGDW